MRANSGFGIYVTGSFNVLMQNDSNFNFLGDFSDQCRDDGTNNHFVKISDTTGASAFDNICG